MESLEILAQSLIRTIFQCQVTTPTTGTLLQSITAYYNVFQCPFCLRSSPPSPPPLPSNQLHVSHLCLIGSAPFHVYFHHRCCDCAAYNLSEFNISRMPSELLNTTPTEITVSDYRRLICPRKANLGLAGKNKIHPSLLFIYIYIYI